MREARIMFVPFWQSEIAGRRRDVLSCVFGEEKAGKRRWPVSKEKIGGRGQRDKRGNGENGRSGDTVNDGKRRGGKKRQTEKRTGWPGK